MLRKLIHFFLGILIILPLLSINPPKADAATCSGWAKSVASDSENIIDTDKQIRLRVEVGPGAGASAVILVKRDGESNYNTVLEVNDGLVQIPLFSDISDGLLEEIIGYGNRFYFNGKNQGSQPFPVGKYTLALAPQGSTNGNDAYCVLPNFFEVTATDTGPDGFCTITFDDSNNYTIVTNGNDPDVKIKAAFPSGSHNGVHRVRLIFKGRQIDVNPSPNHSDLDKNPSEAGWKIPYFWESGEYKVRLIEHNRIADEGRSCTSKDSFVINTEDKGGGHLCTPENMVGCDTELTPNVPLSLPCPTGSAAGAYSETKGCTKIQTAVGVVGTGAPAFTRWVLGFILSISGGIVILIIIISGYRLMASGGDPEKIKNARDQLTAAIVGLLFIIFSLVILQLITSDVLGLPGFGS